MELDVELTRYRTRMLDKRMSPNPLDLDDL
jgi:hypothetical protein